ncbi:MAG: type II toxin-antitoxin system VapC family toxin [Gammaproteobacteria bacterium]
MRRVFVDTGAWYALIDRADPDHGDVTTQFKAYRGRLVTSNFVFDETLTLLRYRLGWQSAHAFGEQMRAGQLSHHVRVSPQDEEAAWDTFTRYRDQSFSFTDCTSFALMQRLRLSMAIALDDDFRVFGHQLLP